MSRVRNKDTAPELALRRALWAAGVRGWRLYPRNVAGRPDLVFRRWRVAVFVDGAFWHGHPDYYRGQSGPFWDQKIAANKARDRRVDADLAGSGWAVLRFWDFEIQHDVDRCVSEVRTLLEQTRTTTR